MSAKVTGAGAALAALGLAHFAKPQAFEKLITPAFPQDTRRHVYTNGAIETALGVGLLVPKTRRFALAGAAAYLIYLVMGAVRSRG